MNTLRETEDGSLTLYSDVFKQHYHSIFGARSESQCVFIDLGLQYALAHYDEVKIFEMGFGTGLNAFMTFEESKKVNKTINYTGIEAYPIERSEYLKFGSQQLVLHELNWNTKYPLTPNFTFEKINSTIENFESNAKYNVVYYDAFAPESQPELWTVATFEKVASMLEKGGVLVTYCSKGYVQRNLKQVGFQVSKHPGPPRKREIVRAIKL